MQRTCANAWCHQVFEVTESDLAFYEKVSPVFNGKKELIPPPTLCPNCRLQRRVIQRNERTLRRGICASCNQHVLSMYPSDTPFTVFCHACWWNESMDALSFGRTVDPEISFFEQFRLLSVAVPRMSVLNPINENSDYCNFADWNKNCYMIINSNSNEDSFYSTVTLDTKNSSDCLWTTDSELCYECVNVDRSYNVRYSRDSSDCRDSAFLSECRSCSRCLGCANLRQKDLYVFNEKVSEKTYAERLRSIESYPGVQQFRKEYDEFLATQPHPALHVLQCENVSGDHLMRCKNINGSYDGYDSQDCMHCDSFMQLKDCADCHCCVKAELIIENTSLIGYHSGFTAFCRHPKETWFSWDCHNTVHVFGCIGLRQKEYCVLNKQYTKAEYERLVSKIIAKMRTDAEWGEFFPATLSPFAYNETVAQEYFPLTKEQAHQRGWQWRDQKDEIPKVTKVIPAEKLPDSIDDVPDEITEWAVQCEATSRPFKIIRQELEFYRKIKLPIPHFHPDERHRRRMAIRNPRKLWNRECAKCRKPIATSYAPERPEIVYCENCYLKEVY